MAVSLLIGTNDLSGLGKSRKVEVIADQFRDLVEEVATRAPRATLLINGVMPRTRKMAAKVRSLNEHYAAIAAGAGATYVDLWPVLASPDGSLRDALTNDHLHLNRPGYREWTTILRPLLAPFANSRPTTLQDRDSS